MFTYLLIGGIVLIVIEGIIPGFGVFGFTGLLSLLGALYLFLGADTEAAMITAVVAVAAFLILIWFIKKAPSTKVGQKLTLNLESTKDKGYDANDERNDLLGCEGIAHSVLRPAGKAVFDGELVDVVTEGSFYEPGTKVKVVAITGGRVVVRGIDE